MKSKIKNTDDVTNVCMNYKKSSTKTSIKLTQSEFCFF